MATETLTFRGLPIDLDRDFSSPDTKTYLFNPDIGKQLEALGYTVTYTDIPLVRAIDDVLKDIFGDFIPETVWIKPGGEFEACLRRLGWDGRLPDA